MDQLQTLGHHQHTDLPLRDLNLLEHGGVNYNGLRPCANIHGWQGHVQLSKHRALIRRQALWPATDKFEPMEVALPSSLHLQRMPEPFLFDAYFFDGFLSS